MESDIRIIKNLLLFFGAVLGAYLLWLLQSMLIPLALALFLALLFQPILAWLERKHVPYTVSLIGVNVGSLGILGLIGLIIYQTLQELLQEKETLIAQIGTKLNIVLGWVNSIAGLSLTANDVFVQISNMLSVDWLISSSNTLASAVGDLSGQALMAVLYYVIILGSVLKYEQYLKYLDGDTGNDRIFTAFEQVKQSIVTYTKVKVLISLVTGLGYYGICWAFDIDFAFFWGFLAFVLNFIPTIGSIIATLPPLLMGIIQLDSMASLGLMTALMFMVQNIMGNILEPKLMGIQLSLNTVVVLLGLIFWGYIWGITGMILSVPLLVLMKVVLSQLPDAALIVRLMGAAPDKFGEAPKEGG